MLVKLLTLALAAERMRRHRAAARAFRSANLDAAGTVTNRHLGLRSHRHGRT
jgi:hypothetical protein